jgi:hypothetical protein
MPPFEQKKSGKKPYLLPPSIVRKNNKFFTKCKSNIRKKKTPQAPLRLQIKVDCSPLKTQPHLQKGINVFSPPLLLFLNKI